ncbi:hypothetical protein SpCBS45565_g03345 [Spizellomyces sp. 'palustris']|nr:hypothetical protein SpCBS45565_g03345 [Spizellomyces sp. 'palustris']
MKPALEGKALHGTPIAVRSTSGELRSSEVKRIKAAKSLGSISSIHSTDIFESTNRLHGKGGGSSRSVRSVSRDSLSENIAGTPSRSRLTKSKRQLSQSTSKSNLGSQIERSTSKANSYSPGQRSKSRDKLLKAVRVTSTVISLRKGHQQQKGQKSEEEQKPNSSLTETDSEPKAVPPATLYVPIGKFLNSVNDIQSVLRSVNATFSEISRSHQLLAEWRPTWPNLDDIKAGKVPLMMQENASSLLVNTEQATISEEDVDEHVHNLEDATSSLTAEIEAAMVLPSSTDRLLHGNVRKSTRGDYILAPDVESESSAMSTLEAQPGSVTYVNPLGTKSSAIVHSEQRLYLKDESPGGEVHSAPAPIIHSEGAAENEPYPKDTEIAEIDAARGQSDTAPHEHLSKKLQGLQGSSASSSHREKSNITEGRSNKRPVGKHLSALDGMGTIEATRAPDAAHDEIYHASGIPDNGMEEEHLKSVPPLAPSSDASHGFREEIRSKDEFNILDNPSTSCGELPLHRPKSATSTLFERKSPFEPRLSVPDVVRKSEPMLAISEGNLRHLRGVQGKAKVMSAQPVNSHLSEWQSSSATNLNRQHSAPTGERKQWRSVSVEIYSGSRPVPPLSPSTPQPWEDDDEMPSTRAQRRQRERDLYDLKSGKQVDSTEAVEKMPETLVVQEDEHQDCKDDVKSTLKGAQENLKSKAIIVRSDKAPKRSLSLGTELFSKKRSAYSISTAVKREISSSRPSSAKETLPQVLKKSRTNITTTDCEVKTATTVNLQVDLQEKHVGVFTSPLSSRPSTTHRPTSARSNHATGQGVEHLDGQLFAQLIKEAIPTESKTFLPNTMSEGRRPKSAWKCSQQGHTSQLPSLSRPQTAMSSVSHAHPSTSVVDVNKQYEHVQSARPCSALRLRPGVSQLNDLMWTHKLFVSNGEPTEDLFGMETEDIVLEEFNPPIQQRRPTIAAKQTTAGQTQDVPPQTAVLQTSTLEADGCETASLIERLQLLRLQLDEKNENLQKKAKRPASALSIWSLENRVPLDSSLRTSSARARPSSPHHLRRTSAVEHYHDAGVWIPDEFSSMESPAMWEDKDALARMYSQIASMREQGEYSALSQRAVLSNSVRGPFKGLRMELNPTLIVVDDSLTHIPAEIRAHSRCTSAHHPTGTVVATSHGWAVENGDFDCESIVVDDDIGDLDAATLAEAITNIPRRSPSPRGRARSQTPTREGLVSEMEEGWFVRNMRKEDIQQVQASKYIEVLSVTIPETESEKPNVSMQSEEPKQASDTDTNEGTGKETDPTIPVASIRKKKKRKKRSSRRKKPDNATSSPPTTAKRVRKSSDHASLENKAVLGSVTIEEQVSNDGEAQKTNLNASLDAPDTITDNVLENEESLFGQRLEAAIEAKVKYRPPQNVDAVIRSIMRIDNHVKHLQRCLRMYHNMIQYRLYLQMIRYIQRAYRGHRVRLQYLRCLQLKRSGRNMVLAMKQLERIDEGAIIRDNGEYQRPAANVGGTLFHSGSDISETPIISSSFPSSISFENSMSNLNPLRHRILVIVRRRKNTETWLRKRDMLLERRVVWGKYKAICDALRASYWHWFDLLARGGPPVLLFGTFVPGEEEFPFENVQVDFQPSSDVATTPSGGRSRRPSASVSADPRLTRRTSLAPTIPEVGSRRPSNFGGIPQAATTKRVRRSTLCNPIEAAMTRLMMHITLESVIEVMDVVSGTS